MKRALPTFLMLIVAVVFGAACADNPVGRPCFIGIDAGTDQETILASPALECQSRICLHLAGAFATGTAEDLCTAECSSDDDCDKDPATPESCTKFKCMVPTTAGPFCCKKMCVCEDYVVLPDGGLPPPEACNPSNPVNECCNLSGRRGNPMYPQCK